MGEIDKRLSALGLILPEPAAPMADYVPSVKTGNLLFVSGQVPVEGNALMRGQLSAADHASGNPPCPATGSPMDRACHAQAQVGPDLNRQHTRAILRGLGRGRHRLIHRLRQNGQWHKGRFWRIGCSGLRKDLHRQPKKPLSCLPAPI